jgi:hypothetical protein
MDESLQLTILKLIRIFTIFFLILMDESLKTNTNTHVILNKVNIIKY